MSLIRKITLTGALVLIALPRILHAEEMSSVAVAGAEKIDRFGVCRNVSNAGDSGIMVPYGVEDEWYNGSDSFLNNLDDMDHVGVTSCGVTYQAISGYNQICSGDPFGICLLKFNQKSNDWRSAGEKVYQIRVSGAGTYTHEYIDENGAIQSFYSNSPSYIKSKYNGWGIPESLSYNAIPAVVCSQATKPGIYVASFWDQTAHYASFAQSFVCK